MNAVCFTVAVMDYFPKIKQYFPGGNALNQAARLRSMGVETAFIGALGTDTAGNRIESLLRSAKVDISRLRRLNGKTASNQIVNDQNGERYGVPGAWDSGVYERFRFAPEDWEYIENFDVWVTHSNCPEYLAVLEKKEEDHFLSVDFLHLEDHSLLEKSMGLVDLAFVGGFAGQAPALKKLSRNSLTIIVLTLGAGGSVAFIDGHEYWQEALPLDQAVDTTGCGDAFQAAFLYSYFETKDIRQALCAAAVAGRSAATRYGALCWELS